MVLKQGIYEQIINQETERNIKQAEQSGLVCVQQPIDSAESPQMLANLIHHNTSSCLRFVERFIAGESVHIDEANRTYAIRLY